MKTPRAFSGIVSFMALVMVMQASAQSFLTNGLVAYYPFNGNADDASGNGNNGIVQGATMTSNRYGMPNSAYYFNGAQSRIRLPETIFNATNIAVTISAWVTTDNGPYTGSAEIFHKGNSNGEMVLHIDNSGHFAFGAKLSGGNQYNASWPMASNSITHLVGVYRQGQSVSLYLNGVLASSTPVPNESLWTDTGYPLASAIGIYDYTPSPYLAFRGIIDDVRIYTNTLSDSEIQQLYQIEANEAGPIIGLIKAVKPVFYGLGITTNYQLQVSSDLVNWTNQGSAFTSTNATMVYPQYLNVSDWNQLYFRLKVSP